MLMDRRGDLHLAYPLKTGIHCTCTYHTPDTATQPQTATCNRTCMPLIPSLTLNDNFLCEAYLLPFFNEKSILGN